MSWPALGVPLSLLSAVGLLLNGYILVVVVLTRQVASANNLLLLHLGAVDALLGALFFVFAAPSLTTSRTSASWSSSGSPCTLHGFLFTLLHPIALWTVCGLNCDRYYAISAPLHYSALVSTRKVIIGLGCAWFVSLLLCIPPFFTVAPYRYSTYLGACAPDFATGDGVVWYSALYTAVTLLLPAALILACNIKVLMIARYHRHRIASAIYEVTLSAQVTITHQRNPFFVPTVTAPSHGGPKFRGRSAISTVLQLLGSFLLLYFPYYCVILWESTASVMISAGFRNVFRVHPHIITAASALITCSPPINGLLYGLKNKSLRKTFQNYWRKQMTKSEINQEIQARTPSNCGSRRPSLTPLGILSKPVLQRRLSEALIDVNKGNSPQRSKMKRIASELTWRPGSSSGFGVSFAGDGSETRTIPHTASCNTLQVPSRDIDEITTARNEDIHMSFKNKPKDPRTRISTTNLFLQKVFGTTESNPPTPINGKRNQLIKTSPARRSPRILITRAFSEESDKSASISGSPIRNSKDMNRRQSCSATTLLERKWRNLRFKSDDETSDSETTSHSTTVNSRLSNVKPVSQVAGDRNSDSSTASDASSGRMYMSLDDHTSFTAQDGDSDTTATAEEPLLLSWPIARKSKIKQNGHSPPRPRPIKEQTLINDNSTLAT